MKVKATLTRREEVTLDESEILKIVGDTIREAFNVPSGCHVDDKGMLIETWEEYGGSHSWYDSKVLRKATPSDRAAVTVMKKLNCLHASRY